MNRIPKLAIVFIMLISTNCATAAYDLSFRSANSIPQYCQEDLNGCGEAVIQMILEGYPRQVEHKQPQANIQNKTRQYRGDLRASWATEPHGMKETLMDLGGGQGVNWEVLTDPNAQSLMYSVIYFMAKNRFPTAALVGSPCSTAGSFQHWIMIEGFSTDADPATATAPVELRFVDVVNPWPWCPPASPTGKPGGERRSISGTTWYDKYMHLPGNLLNSAWNGNYLAVVQHSPKEQIPGKLAAKAPAPSKIAGKTVLGEEEAKSSAWKQAKDLGLAKKEEYSDFLNQPPLQAFLVNERYKGYYIVAFPEAKSKKIQGAVIVNAYDGRFEEISRFQQPIQYRSESQAKEIACRGAVSAHLIFEYTEPTQSPFFPMWQVSCEGNKIVYVSIASDDRRVYDQLRPLIPGQYPATWK
jgi:hypothetical protein